MSSTAAGKPAPIVDKRDRRRVMISSYIGSTVEFYDFILYATAASLVFPKLFFSDLDPLAGTIASFGTLAAGYFARPVGAIIFGHFGDKVGRKRMLIITLVIMGAVSFLIGLLPTREAIGGSAATILIVLRVVQGVAVGGEWAGGALMSMEHAQPGKRGFAASIATSGGPTGAVLATVVLTLFSLLPSDVFLSWGWRVPFLLSAVLVVIGLIIRVSVTESPEFVQEQPTERPAVPIVEVVRHYPTRVVSAVIGSLAQLFMQSIMASFMLTYAVRNGHSETQALIMATIMNITNVFSIIGFAALSDRIGRKPVMISGAVAGVILIAPIFWLVAQGSWWTLLIGFVVGDAIVQGLMAGPGGAWISEKFPTRVRYTGASLSYQLASTLGAGLAPLIATSLLAAGGGTDVSSIIYVFLGLCVASGIAIALSRETSGRRLAAREATSAGFAAGSGQAVTGGR